MKKLINLMKIVMFLLFAMFFIACSSDEQVDEFTDKDTVSGSDVDFGKGDDPSGNDGDGRPSENDPEDDRDSVSTDSKAGDGTGSDVDGEVDDADEVKKDKDITIPDGDVGDPDGMGPETANPYESGIQHSNGVVVGEGGKLKLDNSTTRLRYLWVSNSGDGTVSKVDTFTQEEVGRFNVGEDASSNPSRTSVDKDGNVFIGNRGEPTSVTKISGHDDMCIDKDNDGKIKTSTGPNDILPRGDDECVIWNKKFVDGDGRQHKCRGIRAVAATAEDGVNFEVSGHVWVGCYADATEGNVTYGDNVAYKLHGNTGDILETMELTQNSDKCYPYGFVLDSEEKMWISCRKYYGQGDGKQGVAWFDSTDQDPFEYTPDKTNPYGIAIDREGYIWTTDLTNHIQRYDPKTKTWDQMVLTTNESTTLRGIAADDDGFVWVITSQTSNFPPSKIYLIDSKLFPHPDSQITFFELGDGNSTPTNGTGVAIDMNDNVWGVSKCNAENVCGDNGFVTFLEMDRSGVQPSLKSKKVIPIGKQPYVYSDMIGHMLHGENPEGWYSQKFHICASSISTWWKTIYWDADIPADTSIKIRARASDVEADLPNLQFKTIVESPTDVSPLDISQSFPHGKYIEIEVRLYTDNIAVTPSVGAVKFEYTCYNPS